MRDIVSLARPEVWYCSRPGKNAPIDWSGRRGCSGDLSEEGRFAMLCEDWVLFGWGAAFDGVKGPKGWIGEKSEAVFVATAARVSSGDSGSGPFVE